MIINISDHFTRLRCGAAAAEGKTRVLGALFGVQTGLVVDVLDSFELVYECKEGEYCIDAEFVQSKVELCKCMQWSTSLRA